MSGSPFDHAPASAPGAAPDRSGTSASRPAADEGPTVLERIVADVRRRRAAELRSAPSAAHDRTLPDRAVDDRAVPDRARRDRFVAALRADELSVIAELKRRSPSAGTIAPEVDLAARARAYAAGGAAALSVLTERDHFGGAPEDLARVADAGLPRLRKDFLLAPADVDASARLGADAVLLIAAVLDDAQLASLRARADALGLAVLAEVHDAAELERVLEVEPDAIGVNARDLRTFAVDLGAVERLLPRVPARFVRVAESGVRTVDDARRVRRAGADAVLVGEALMRSPEPSRLVAGLRRCDRV